MKKLLLLWFFSTSLSSFSQDTLMQYPSGLHYIKRGNWIDSAYRPPDTLRCTLIYFYDNGPSILRTMPGFVVRTLRTAIGSQRFYDDIYLDDKKKVIKKPWEVLTYKLKQ